MMTLIRQAAEELGVTVPMTKLCDWFGIPRRSAYYKPRQRQPKVQERFAAPIKAMLEEHPAFGYRTVAHLLDFNKNTVQRVFQLMGWQVQEAAHWLSATDSGLAFGGTTAQRALGDGSLSRLDGARRLAVLALVIDCHTRELLGWHLSRSGKARTAESALEQALIARYGTLGRVASPFLLRSDNGLVFTSRSYTALVRSYGLQQEFITPHCPEQNGMVERVIRTLNEQCTHRHRFETLQHASRVIGDWIGFYNTRRPHQALGIKTPAEAFALAA